MPARAALGKEDRYVPAGWFWSGSGSAGAQSPRRRLWADGLVVRRFPVTNRAYLGFLDSLVLAGAQEGRCSPGWWPILTAPARLIKLRKELHQPTFPLKLQDQILHLLKLA